MSAIRLDEGTASTKSERIKRISSLATIACASPSKMRVTAAPTFLVTGTIQDHHMRVVLE